MKLENLYRYNKRKGYSEMTGKTILLIKKFMTVSYWKN